MTETLIFGDSLLSDSTNTLMLNSIVDYVIHCVKYRNFPQFPGVEILRKGTVSAQFRAIRYSFHIVSGDSSETMRKLCLSSKFPHQEVRGNFGILRSDRHNIQSSLIQTLLSFGYSNTVSKIQIYSLQKYCITKIRKLQIIRFYTKTLTHYCSTSPFYVPENIRKPLSGAFRQKWLNRFLYITCNDLNVYNCLQIKKGQTLNSVFAQFSMRKIS